jgi:hypothetical protein
MTQIHRRQVLGTLATASLALIGGVASLFPESRLLRANAASATMSAPAGRVLRGRVLMPGAFAHAIAELRESRDGARGLSIMRAEGFAARIEDAIGVAVDWDDGESVGTAILVPLFRGTRRGLLVRRVTRDGVLTGTAIEDEAGWVHVTADTADGSQEEASFQRRADGTFLVRGANGSVQILTTPGASDSRNGRRGLAAPFVADPICTTICNWVTNVQCTTFWTLTAIFVCAWIAVDSLGTLAIACGLTFLALAVVSCAAYQEWVCGTLCAW